MYWGNYNSAGLGISNTYDKKSLNSKSYKPLIISGASFFVFLLLILSTRLINIYSYRTPDILSTACMIFYIIACIFMTIDFCKFKPNLRFLGLILGVVSLLTALSTNYFGQYILIGYYCFRLFSYISMKFILFLSFVGAIMITNLLLQGKVVINHNNEQWLVNAKEYNIEYKDLFD